MHKVREIIANAMSDMRQDGWQNVLTNIGVDGKDWRQATKFKRREYLDQNTIESMYEQDAIFARIIDSVPNHATRRWISVQAQDGPEDFQASVLDHLKKLNARKQFHELLRLERLDGGAAMVIGADDGLPMSEPLNKATIKAVRYLNVVTRYEIFPGEMDRDPTSPNFREPKYYDFAGGAQTSSRKDNRIHWSRVIRAKGIQVSMRQDASRGGWGLPEAERVWEALRQYGSVYGYTEALFKDLVQGVMTIKGLAEILAHDDSKIIDRLTLMSLAASAFNAVLLDEGESYERRTIQLGGIPEIMVKTMDKLSAVSEIPVSILFGQAPTGFSVDDSASRTTFYDSIRAKQDDKLRPGLERVIEALLWSKTGPTQGVVPSSWSMEFEPLESPSEQEQATTRKLEADTDVVLIQSGILTEEEARTRLEGDPSSPYRLEPLPEDGEAVDPDDEDVAEVAGQLAAVPTF